MLEVRRDREQVVEVREDEVEDGDRLELREADHGLGQRLGFADLLDLPGQTDDLLSSLGKRLVGDGHGRGDLVAEDALAAGDDGFTVLADVVDYRLERVDRDVGKPGLEDLKAEPVVGWMCESTKRSTGLPSSSM